ncbi:hypothetical protein ABNO07_003580 [Salmonella enterica subsp. enterica serovar Bareilly]
MILIQRNSLNVIKVELKKNGQPVAVGANDPVTFAMMNRNGKQLSAFWHSAQSDAKFADWANGIIVLEIDATLSPEKDQFNKLDNGLLVVQTGLERFMFEVKFVKAHDFDRSQLFVKDIDVPRMRENQLLVAASGAMREVQLTDDYIWDKLRAAESEVAHTLRILLTPHQVFPDDPTEDEIAALDGMPYIVETPYDYSPNMYDRDKWGYFVTRQRPIISVQRLRFRLPSADSQFFDIPLEWLKLDEKYGHVRLLPTTNASLVTSSMLGFTALTWQSIIPNMLNLTYQAGIKNAHEDYPELIDAIKKMAVVKIITDLFLPQSGSISADGLSESMSTDVAKYQEQVDKIMNGQDGNGGLMALFNGIRMIII